MPLWGKLLIGCGGLVTVAVGVLVFLGVQLAATSPLASFPHYPGAAQTNVNWNSMNGQRTDRLELDTFASQTDVLSYYEKELSTNGWVDDGFEASTGTLRFHRAAHSGEKGVVVLLEQGSTTVIEVTYQS